MPLTAVEEYGPDIVSIEGLVVPVTYVVQFWEEDDFSTLRTIQGVTGQELVASGLRPATYHKWRVMTFLSEKVFSDWSPPGLFQTPVTWLETQEIGFDIFVGRSTRYMAVVEQGTDTFLGVGSPLVLAPINLRVSNITEETVRAEWDHP